MRILVTVASRHGATAELATEIGRILREMQRPRAEVDVHLVDEVTSLKPYDAVILGSAIYLEHWLDEAAQFALRRSEDLQRLPVWLFSSGPIGDVLGADGRVGADVQTVIACTRARDYRVFPGKIDMHHLGPSEHGYVQRLRVPEGDYRDWAAVRAWAGDIAAQLATGERELRRRQHASQS